MRERKRNRNGIRKTSWQCPKKTCRKELSIVVGNLWISSTDKQGRHCHKLPVNQVLEIIWFFLFIRCTIRDAAIATEHSTSTIVEWWLMWRHVCTAILELQPKFFGDDSSPIQIDERYVGNTIVGG